MDGPKILLVGDSGSGKTTALAALAKAGITPNILMLDDGTRVPAILNSPPGVVNYHRHRDTGLEWSDLKAMSKSLRTKTNKQIQEEDRVGARNSLSFDQMVDVVIQEFIDDRTGTSLGSALEWGPEQAFCLDSVSELNDICQHTAVGAKAIQSIADWGAMMNLEERFLKKCLLALPCTVVVTAHLSKEKDEVHGGMLVAPQFLGAKLGPRMIRWFDEVICCKQEGKDYHWSTNERNMTLKRRLMPLSPRIKPDWSILFDQLRKEDTQ